MAVTFGSSAERQRLLHGEVGELAVEGIGGFGVIVLSVLGLAGLDPMLLTAAAGIIFGIAMVGQGAAISSEYAALFAKVTAQESSSEVELGGSTTVEFVVGGAAIILGILALVGQAPSILLPSLAIAAGAALMITSGTAQRLTNLKLETSGASDVARRVASHSVAGVVGAQFLFGIAAIVLGIIALIFSPSGTTAIAGNAASWMNLTLVALLVLGSGMALTGGAMASRMGQMFGAGRPTQAPRP